MKPITITKLNEIISIGEYEPGNGYNYKAIAVKFSSEADFNVLGSVYVSGWLVVNCNNKQAYLFQKTGVLTDIYLHKKLGGYSGDYPFFGDLIRRLIGRDIKS